MNRVDRLVGILTMLQSQKFATAARISERFEISARTVYRDIRALEEIGVPVSFEQNRGYFIVEGYFLPPVTFTPEEANALVLLSAFAGRFGDDSVAAHTSRAIEKVRAILKSRDQEVTHQLSAKIRVLDPDPNPTPSAFLGDIQKSISTNTILEIDYTDAKKQRTTREIEPIGIIYYTDQWHLIAFCWLRNDYRDFIVKQINTLTLTSKPFIKTDHISIDDHIQGWQLP